MRLMLIFVVLLLHWGSASAQAYKAVKDWVGGCDNTRHCTAVGLAAADAEHFALLHFERGPGPDDSVSSIRLRIDQEISREQAWVLLADDAELFSFDSAHLVDADSGSGIDFVVSAADELEALLGAMRSADGLTLRSDAAVGRISLAGASAIMLWIDEQQGRLGTRTALLRRGDKSPQSVPAPAALPSLRGTAVAPIAPAEVTALSARLRADLPADSCEPVDAESAMGDAAWLVAGEVKLVQLQCYAGAYNFGSSWFLLDGQNPARPLLFAQPDASGAARLERVADIVNADFDPAAGRLYSFNKGRGMGDCGSLGVWLWDGRDFQLAAYSLMNDCRGVSSDLWPVLWRTRQ